MDMDLAAWSTGVEPAVWIENCLLVTRFDCCPCLANEVDSQISLTGIQIACHHHLLQRRTVISFEPAHLPKRIVLNAFSKQAIPLFSMTLFQPLCQMQRLLVRQQRTP